MMMLSDFVITLMKEWQIDDLPINVLIDNKYYDIDSFYFDETINEYILKIGGAADYKTRGDIVDPKIILKVNKNDEMEH